MAADPVALERVWKVFAAPALRDVTFTASAGEIVAVLGPNGAGKSTLLRVIAGLARPSRGQVRVHGGEPARPDARRVIGLAGHDSCLAGHLTALENLQFYADLYGLPAARAHAVMEEFDLTRRRHQQVRTLSRGTVQRLNVARALLHEPAVVLLDEPFTGLDAAVAGSLRSRLTRMRNEGRCVIMSSHDAGEAAALADTVIVLIGGRLAAREPARTVDAARLLNVYAVGAVRPPAPGPRPVAPV